MNLLLIAPLVLAILSICGVIGGFFAMRAGYFQQAGRAQELSIDAMRGHIETQKLQISALEKRVEKHEGALDALQVLLKPYSLHFEINGGTVRLIEDGMRGRASTVEIHIEKPDEKEA